MHLVCPHCHTTNRVAEENLSKPLGCGSCHADLLPDHPVAVDARGLQAQIAKSALPVVVDFWAPWCGPCRMMAPEFEKAAAQLRGRALFVKLDTEAHPEVGARHAIRSIPTLAVFQRGQEVARRSGAMRANELVHWVQQAA